MKVYIITGLHPNNEPYAERCYSIERLSEILYQLSMRGEVKEETINVETTIANDSTIKH
jgi:hypothetical protein